MAHSSTVFAVVLKGRQERRRTARGRDWKEGELFCYIMGDEKANGVLKRPISPPEPEKLLSPSPSHSCGRIGFQNHVAAFNPGQLGGERSGSSRGHRCVRRRSGKG